MCLPTERDSRQSFTNIPAIVAGWGVTSDRNPDLSDVLLEANVTTITNNECELQFPTVVQEQKFLISRINDSILFQVSIITFSFVINFEQQDFLY